jgi:hypothetical protein
MILQVLVSSAISGTIAVLAWMVVSPWLAVGLGLSVGVVVGRLMEAKRLGRAPAWPVVLAHGLAAGTTGWLVMLWLHR